MLDHQLPRRRGQIPWVHNRGWEYNRDMVRRRRLDEVGCRDLMDWEEDNLLPVEVVAWAPASLNNILNNNHMAEETSLHIHLHNNHNTECRLKVNIITSIAVAADHEIGPWEDELQSLLLHLFQLRRYI